LNAGRRLQFCDIGSRDHSGAGQASTRAAVPTCRAWRMSIERSAGPYWPATEPGGRATGESANPRCYRLPAYLKDVNSNHALGQVNAEWMQSQDRHPSPPCRYSALFPCVRKPTRWSAMIEHEPRRAKTALRNLILLNYKGCRFRWPQVWTGFAGAARHPRRDGSSPGREFSARLGKKRSPTTICFAVTLRITALPFRAVIS